MAKARKLVPADYDFTVFSKEADVDYLLARFISYLGNGFFSRAAYFAHAACEKYMKAYTVQEGSRYLERHALLEIAETCLPYNSYFGEQETKRILGLFDSFEQVGRYGAGANYDPLATKTPDMETKGVMVWYVSYIQHLDAFVYKVRSLLNFFQKTGDGSAGGLSACLRHRVARPVDEQLRAGDMRLPHRCRDGLQPIAVEIAEAAISSTCSPRYSSHSNRTVTPRRFNSL